MNIKVISVMMVLLTTLLLAQTVSIVDAHHNPDSRNENGRKAMEEKSKDYDKQGNKKEVIEEKKKAFLAYKTAFAAWKTAKEDYKSAKSSGEQTVINAKKVILDAAKIVKENAFAEYKEALKHKAR
jgi:hypothetical protein